MKGSGRGGSAWRSARLPALLLLFYLALIGGTLIYLTLASAPSPDRIGDIAPPSGGGERPDEPSRPAPPAETAPPPAEPAPPAEPPPPTETAPPDTPEPVPPPPPPPEPPGAATQPPAEPAPPAAPPPPATATAPPPAPRLPRLAVGPPLAAAPDPGLIQNSAFGPLPVIGRDGREAWRVYARPFDAADKRPRIAVVIYGLGISDAATETAIQSLPGAVSLAFSPYGDEIGMWIVKARAAGHEVLMMTPMEPDNYPAFDPGPQALLTSLDPNQNVERLEWILGRATGHIGVVSYLGGRFAGSRRHVTPVLRAVKNRGLMYVDNRSGGAVGEIANQLGVPFAASAFFIDEKAARPTIDARLAELETLAKQTGRAIALGYPYPVTLERLAAWARTVETRGFALAPISAMAVRNEHP